MEKFNKLKEIVASVEADAQKFYESGNKAAGTRLRKALQDIKVLAQQVRAEVSELKGQDKA